jgi:hypothetical protein
MNILLGLVFIILGTLILNFHRLIYRITGHMQGIQDWFPGGTYNFIRIFAVALTILGIFNLVGIIKITTLFGG